MNNKVFFRTHALTDRHSQTFLLKFNLSEESLNVQKSDGLSQSKYTTLQECIQEPARGGGSFPPKKKSQIIFSE